LCIVNVKGHSADATAVEIDGWDSFVIFLPYHGTKETHAMSRRAQIAFLVPLVVAVAAPLPLSAEQRTPPGFAVVELFTSEGCSSCPPADEAMSRLVREADEKGLPIYALDWHVDYWDYLGWKDPWGSRFATDRQYAYARSLPSSVYTPQVVVNGQFVPSYAGDLHELEALTSSAANRPAQASLRLATVRQETPTSIRMVLETVGAPPGSRVLVAEVEGDLAATPNAGENAGRRLEHSNVVRAAMIVPASNGDVTLEVPPPTPGTTRRIVALLESSSSLHVVAATQVRLTDAPGDELSGRVFDSTGMPVSGALIQACSASLCIPARTDTDGRFVLSGMHSGSYEIDFDIPGASAGPGTVQFFTSPRAVHITKTVWRYAGR